ncbi:MAG: tRNA (adenosine(37)-N6)-dimethylallyltransferase MiaA [Armatimonadota bacterium]|nr:tRNA (adenosine(37)-N6)-dimethylallyltransferase MiaA [bacterium]MDW8103792.1 tRNA (adenosine(37)-N6)-dimethylallyltransferase MiaA [Armatimonadota bacterium]MDW8289266.1 tRNA (adenosine(37)-N6)-dimethylallyltransferase MiaA [Armatimonadota bacterium]
MSDLLPDVLAIVGPTATGKTEVGILLAEALGGEIISADCMAVYRGMDIGTAKPTPEQQRRVRFHLIDVCFPNEPFSVAQFQQMALEAVRQIRQRGRLPIVVGGTGLYVKALLDGFRIPPAAANHELRQQLWQEVHRVGSAALHARLQEVDPLAASRIHPNDAVRIIRALEVYHVTGRPISEWQQRHPPAEVGRARRFGLTMQRELLYARINQRVEQMVARGWLQEVHRLLQAGYAPDLPAMRSLGYAELVLVAQGKMDLQQAIALIQRETRRFAKRQFTWFRADKQIEWMDASSGAEETARHILERLRSEAEYT